MLIALQTTPILIVDDDEVLGHVLSRVLKREGRSIVRAASAAQAMELAQQQHPRLALLDLCLPDGDGIELARRLQAAYPDLALILMTAYPLRLREQPDLAECFTRVLTKPLNLQELRQAVDVALAEGDLAGAAGSEGSASAPRRPLPIEPVRHEAPAARISTVTIVKNPSMPPSTRPWYFKPLGITALAVALLLAALFAAPFFSLPGLETPWRPTAETKLPESTPTPLAVELVKDRPHTLAVPETVQLTLGIRKGNMDTSVAATLPKQPRQLILPGSTMLDPTRLSRIRLRFPADVVEIRQVVDEAARAKSGRTEERELHAGDAVRKDEVLLVVRSTEVAAKKSELVNAWVQLHFDQDLLARSETARTSIPEVLLLTARRNVRADQNAITNAVNTLTAWGIPKEDIDALHKEADEITTLELNELLDKEKEAELARRKEAWTLVKVKAPVAGTIIERNVSLHETVVDNTVNLFVIAQVDRLAIVANAPEDDLPALLALEPAQMRWTVRTAADAAGKGISAPFDEVGYLIDPNQHTAVVKGRIDNPDHKLRGGQFVSVAINLDPPEDVVEIPITALVEDGRQSVVFVQTDPNQPNYTMRRVQVTHRFDKVAYVRSKPFTKEEELKPEDKDRGLLPREALRRDEIVLTNGVMELKAALEDKESGEK
jgi:membrane fusion protein, heavy metal efflux system